MANIGFFPNYSEANPYQRELAEALEEEGHSVKMFKEKVSIPKKAEENKLDILHLHWLKPYIHGENTIETLAKTCSTAAKLLLLKIKGINTVWTVHNIKSHDRKYPRTERLFKLFCTMFIFDNILVHCASTKRKLKENYNASEKQIKVVKHGNYINSYPNNIRKEEAREKLDLNQEKKIVLFFGQIREYKGLKELLDRFKNLEQEEITLLIAGNAKDKEIASDIKKKASKDNRIVINDNFIPKEKVQNYMNASDFLVLPYKNITTSGTLILAMSFGKPVIAPKKGCIPEHVSREDTILFKSMDKIGEAIQRALEEDFLEKGERNLEKARKMEWNEIAQKTSNIYRSLL